MIVAPTMNPIQTRNPFFVKSLFFVQRMFRSLSARIRSSSRALGWFAVLSVTLSPLLGYSVSGYSQERSTAIVPVTSPTASPKKPSSVSKASVPESLSHKMRDYRIEVYRAFRLDRAEFDQRRQAAEKLVESWQAAQGSAATNQGKHGSIKDLAINDLANEDLENLLDWFTRSTKALQEGHLASLPEPTTWGEQLAKSARPAPKLSAAPISPPSISMPPLVIERRVTERRVTLRKANTIPIRQTRTASVVPPARIELPPSIVALKPSIVARTAAEPVPPAPEPKVIVFKQVSPVPPVTIPPVTIPPVISPPVTTPLVTPVASKPLANKPIEKIAPRIPISREVETPGRRVKVNLNELSARVRGWNFALKKIENRTIQSTNPTVEDITQSVDNLRTLLERRRMVALYQSTLSEREKAQVGKLHSPASTAELLLSQIKSAQQRYAHLNQDEASPREKLESLRQLLEEIQE